jgi:hypothetical protein
MSSLTDNPKTHKPPPCQGSLTKIAEISQLMPIVNANADAELVSDLDAAVEWATARGSGGNPGRLGIIGFRRGLGLCGEQSESRGARLLGAGGGYPISTMPNSQIQPSPPPNLFVISMTIPFGSVTYADRLRGQSRVLSPYSSRRPSSRMRRTVSSMSSTTNPT